MRAYSARMSVDDSAARVSRDSSDDDDADGAARVVDIDRLPAPVVRMDLHRRVHAARGRAADQQRHVEALPLHFGGDMAHLVERRRDQAGQPDDVGLLGRRRLQDFLRRHHDAEIDHVVIVALEHDADDVLADVVHVALDGREHDLAVRAEVCARPSFSCSMYGMQIGDRLLHHPRRLDHLRQEHSAGAEQVADHVHAVHQRAFDHGERARRLVPRFLDVGRR